MHRIFLSIFALIVTSCAEPTYAPVVPEALGSPVTRSVFVATNRGRNAQGFYDHSRAETVSYLDTIVSMPPDRSPGEAPVFKRDPDPKRDFVIAQQDELQDLDQFVSKIRTQLQAAPADHQELSVFVHGFYNTYSNALFRTAQVANDLELTAPVVNFTWPSAGHPLGYAYDRESVLFARDDLEKLLLALPRAQPEGFILVGHSMGAHLVMETLRQIELIQPGWSHKYLKGLVLLAPDIPVDVFVRTTERFDSLPEPFIIFASNTDRALSLSNHVNGSAARLGQIDSPQTLDTLPVIIFDISDFSQRGSNNHMIFAESPALLKLMRDANQIDTILNSEPLLRDYFGDHSTTRHESGTTIHLSSDVAGQQTQ